MSTTKRIVYAFVAAVVLGIVLLFNLNVVAENVAFLGYPLKLAIQYFFMVPFIYFAFGALFPKIVGRQSVGMVIAVTLGAVLYTLLTGLPDWSWNPTLFKLGAILVGGFLVWLFSRAGK